MLGLAAAVILPMSLAVLPVLFTAAERPRAIAAVGGATFLGYPIGPILGGWLLDHFWWGSVFLINIPVVVIAIVAVAVLMPESRGERRQRVDVDRHRDLERRADRADLRPDQGRRQTAGPTRSPSSPWSPGPSALAAFAGWERLLSRPEGGSRKVAAAPRDRQPLVDLGLFRSAGFTWGTLLSTLVSFALFGLVFAMPQYFLDVRGLDSLGAGVRMLPMIGGLALGLGARPAAADAAQGRHPARRRSARRSWSRSGSRSWPPRSAVGTRTTIASGTGFAATWFAVTGFGLGIAMPTALNAALGALSPARSGSGSALITAHAPGRRHDRGGRARHRPRHRLPEPAAPVRASRLGSRHAIKESVAGGVATAQAAGSAPLLETVRLAYVHGLDVMLWVCAGIAIASAVLALAFLPGRTRRQLPRPTVEPAGAEPGRTADGTPTRSPRCAADDIGAG